MFKITNLYKLRLMAFAQVMKNVQSFLAKEENLEEKGLAEVKKEFDEAFSVFENSLATTKKSKQTQSLQELDAERDNLLNNFIAHCRIYQTHPTKSKSEAAKRAVIQIEAYGKGIAKRAYRDETTIIRSLVADFKKEDLAKDIALIGAKEWLDLLAPANQKFDELHSSRTIEQSGKEVGQTKVLRVSMQEKFDRLCKAIDAMAFIKGEENYKTLAAAINEEIKNAISVTKGKNTPA